MEDPRLVLEEDELRRRSGRLCGWWRERVSHLSDGHRRMLHEQPSAAAVALVAKRGKERDAARAGRGRDVVRVPIDVVNQRRGGLVERALWALVELAERVALAHLKRWLLLRPRRLRASCRRRWHGWRGGTVQTDRGSFTYRCPMGNHRESLVNCKAKLRNLLRNLRNR